MLSGINEQLALPILAERPKLRLASKTRPAITGKNVLVTGAGGSIGSELVCQIAESDPRSLIILDHSEFALYQIAQTLTESRVPFPVVPALIDVRDGGAVRDLFWRNPVDTVLHAAAYKHVPLLETTENAIEGLRVNVLGTSNVLDGAWSKGARFVLVSTDKAAEPTSFMGLTKRLAEIAVMAKCQNYDVHADFVRFGNVMGSSGSVIPLFQRQIAHRRPVTVTDPEMTRYFMTIKQAVTLVLDVAGLPAPNEKCAGLFVLDMGEPVKIIDIARQLIRQAGLEPDVDIPIQIIGMRPGEKLHEVLHFPYEELKPSGIAGVSQGRPTIEKKQGMQSAMLHQFILSRDIDRVRELLQVLVPEYQGEDPWWR